MNTFARAAVLASLVVSLLSAQLPRPGGGSGGGSSTAPEPPTAQSVPAVTTLTIDTTSLNTTKIVVECRSGLGVGPVVASTVTALTATSVTVTFSSTANIRCVAVGPGGVGATGATGATGPAPSGTGVVKVTSGVAGLVTGTATDCVLVDGSSGACGTGGGGTWGSITGTLSDQTDLQTALDAKQPLDSELTTIASKTIAGNGNTVRLATGSFTSGNAVVTDASGNLIDGGTTPGGGGSAPSVDGPVVAVSSAFAAACLVTRTSSTVLTITNCRVSPAYGSPVVVASATVTVTGGAGHAFIYGTSAGTIAVQRGGTLTISCSSCTDAGGSATDFPAASQRIWDWNATAGAWDATGTDSRQLQVPVGVTPDTGITVSNGVSGPTVGIDTAVVKTQAEISFGICAGTNCAVNDTISIPRIITTASAGSFVKCKAKAGTGPTGSGLSIQVKKNGTTTATVTIADGATLGNTTTFSAGTIAEDDYLTIVVSAIGSSTPGKDVNVICTVQ